MKSEKELRQLAGGGATPQRKEHLLQDRNPSVSGCPRGVIGGPEGVLGGAGIPKGAKEESGGSEAGFRRVLVHAGALQTLRL